MLSTVSEMLAPSPNGAAFRHFLSLIRRHHELVWEMTRREISERYSGQMLGSLWALGQGFVLIEPQQSARLSKS